jgi:uncharacterized membrane protein
MTERVFTIFHFLAALGTGLIAGTFFGFSTFIMRALERLPPPQGIAAMQFINITVLNPLFMGALFGTGMLCLAITGRSLQTWNEPQSILFLAASICYLLALVVTVAFNVPLNDALANFNSAGAEALSFWNHYVQNWTRWNHVRGLFSFASTALFIRALWIS